MNDEAIRAAVEEIINKYRFWLTGDSPAEDLEAIIKSHCTPTPAVDCAGLEGCRLLESVIQPEPRVPDQSSPAPVEGVAAPEQVWIGFEHGRVYSGALKGTIKYVRDDLAASSAGEAWNAPEFAGWGIVGINHYHVEGCRYLFIAMTNDLQRVRAEGEDAQEVFKVLAAAIRTAER